MKERHLFILWAASRELENELVGVIAKEFGIVAKYDIKWSKKYFSANLSRFYGVKLPAGSGKEGHIGMGKFLCVIVDDNALLYGDKETSRGKEFVNVRMFDTKQKLRDMTGGGHRVHCTNTKEEYQHDNYLLFGAKHTHKTSGRVIALNRDLTGHNGWATLDDIITTLNIAEKFVVMRNFDDLLNMSFTEHDDIDLLVNNPDEVALLLGATKVFPENYRVHYNVKLKDGTDIRFDFRYVGDGYYDALWQRKIIEDRVYSTTYNTYIPNTKDHMFGLIYHAILHKKSIKQDYWQQFKKYDAKYTNVPAVSKDLTSYLVKHGYNIVEPDDRSVLYQRGKANRLKSIMLLKSAKTKLFKRIS